MFIRLKSSVHGEKTYEYIQVVRSYRDGKKVRQQVIANLGRRDELVASGQLDGLIEGLSRYSEKLRIAEAVRAKGLRARNAQLWGPPLVFGRLWEEQGVGRIITRLAKERKFAFNVERAAFAMALQRLCEPGSDLQCSKWVETVESPGFDELALQHFYRTAGFLSEVREDLEHLLFQKDRDLFSQSLDVVFMDTTSLYVYRDGETETRKRGYSRDRRGDLPQFVLGVVVDDRGWPIAWEIFPGNTADQKALTEIVKTLRERFSIRKVVVVADRGMISANTKKLLTEHEEAPFDYVLGCRMRRDNEVAEKVLRRSGRYQKVEDNLEVKEVRVGEQRYVVCRNPIEVEKDRHKRESILARLEEKLSRQGPKAMVSNKGFARFLKVAKGSVSIDQNAVERDALLDGKFVLTTSTDMPAADVARTYKSLWRVERTFRKQKSTLEVRPIYHQRDDTSIGHIVASFLALRLEVDLQRRLDERGIDTSWPDLMRDLSRIRAVDVELDGNKYLLRTDMVGSAHQAFAAAGVKTPSPVTPLTASS